MIFKIVILNNNLSHYLSELVYYQVTGKALMLDEIINYVQSLQRQVEVELNKKI